MSKRYSNKTSRSRRKLQNLPDNAVKVEIADGQATFQMVLPMNAMLAEVASSIEQTASQAGLLMMKAMIDEEVEQLAGPRYDHDRHRQAFRWGKQEGHVVFAGRKVAIERPRVRGKGGQEMALRRYEAFQDDRRFQQAVQERVLRRVSMRDYEGVLDDICDGYGIDKSSVSRHWKSASTEQLKQLLERKLDDLELAVLLLDGKAFHDYTLITALGVDFEGRKHVLGLWPGGTENAEVCGALLDDLIERGLSQQERYLFVLDGSKALKKAVKDRFGRQALLQRCRLHKERNIQSHLPKHYHQLLRLKLRAAWNMTDYVEAKRQLEKVHDWLARINVAAARSLEEALEETLTVNRLGLSPELRKAFSTTNLIESSFSLADDLCRNVKRWRDANMAWRWAGTVLQEAQRRFHRVRGYRDMPLLTTALKEGIAMDEAVA
jgi:putative transposase